MNLLWVAQIPTGIVLILSTRERLLKCALVFKKQCALNRDVASSLCLSLLHKKIGAYPLFFGFIQ